MKKISILMALLAVFGMTFTSCKQDTQPRLQEPTEFVLNRPAMADNLYELSADMSVELTWSQPDYGMGVVASYEVQISYTEDFAEYKAVEGVFTNCDSYVPGESFALAMCQLSGYEQEEQFVGDIREVYVRIKSYIPGAEYATIYSNVIKLNAVKPFFAVKYPAILYVIGEVSGWDINNVNAPILSEKEDAVGSNIYYGQFEITAEQAAVGFRFYQSLGSWGDDGKAPSVGAAAKDGDNKSVSLDAETGKYEGKCVFGKGNWMVQNWPGGVMKVTVNLNKDAMSVVFEPAQ